MTVRFQKTQRPKTPHPKRDSRALRQSTELRERTLESLWMDTIPRENGYGTLTWWQAWEKGYPSPEAVEIYNSMHDEEDHIVLEGDDE